MVKKSNPRKSRQVVGDLRDPDSLYHHMQRYLSYLEERNYAARTVEIRDIHLRTFIGWCDTRSLTQPRQLDRPILEQYQRHLFYLRKANGDPLSARSQQGLLTSIRHWLKWLVRQGYLLYSPASELELPRVEKRLPKAILSARDVETILALVDVGSVLGLRDRVILEVFYSTGMRRMELIGLKVHDLDFERGTVMIRQGKGKKDRMIPIGERALAWVARYRDDGRPELVSGRDDGTLFLTNMGEAFSATRLSFLVAECVDRANLGKRGSCHLFRHTMATLMLEAGADTRFIQAMLGHARLDSTQIYTLVSIRQLKAIHEATHPGKLGVVGGHEDDCDLSPEELMAALAREAEEEDEG